MIKQILSLIALSFLLPLSSMAQNRLDLETIFRGKLNAKTLPEIKPAERGDGYYRLNDQRTQVLRCSFRSDSDQQVLFDADKAGDSLINRIDDYSLSPTGEKLLLQADTKYRYRRSFTAEFFVYDIAAGKLQPLSTNGRQEIPTWSPDGKRIAFVRENNIFVVDCATGKEQQITYDGETNAVINGRPDWVYEEEFGLRAMLLFDASGQHLVWLRFDERGVPVFSLPVYKGLKPERKEAELYPSTYTYKYPKAGQQNATVTLCSHDFLTGQQQTLPFTLPEDGYVPRLKASSRADEVFVMTLNRHQDMLTVQRIGLVQGNSHIVLTETSRGYVKEECYSQMIVGKNTLVLPSDRDGNMHLYVYDYNGKLLWNVRPGDFDITDIYAYDESRRILYYQAANHAPYDRQVLATNAKGKTRQLTDRLGWNTAIFSADCRYFINQWSDRNTPYQYSLHNSEGRIQRVLLDNATLQEKLKGYTLARPEIFSFTTENGTSLNGWMVKPIDFDTEKQYPVIMFQYSGPGSQQVVDAWNIGSLGRGALFDAYLAQEGFVVVCVDGRGTGGRGADFEKCTYLQLGRLEAADQVAAAHYLASLPFVDRNRIGIWGWSYGGFNTLMSMSQDNAFFKAGVAVAPPTDWRFYDTIYTERFMRTPEENPTGYDYNPISLAPHLKGSLLLCHGLADDNVHPQNSFEYSEALVQASIDFKQNFYTNRNHSIYGGNTRLHLMRQIASWFQTNL